MQSLSFDKLLEHWNSDDEQQYLTKLRAIDQLKNLLLWELVDWLDYPTESSVQTQKDILSLYRTTFWWTEEWSVELIHFIDERNIVSRFFECDSPEKVKEFISRDVERIKDCPFDPLLLTDPDFTIKPCVKVFELELI